MKSFQSNMQVSFLDVHRIFFALISPILYEEGIETSAKQCNNFMQQSEEENPDLSNVPQ